MGLKIMTNRNYINESVAFNISVAVKGKYFTIYKIAQNVDTFIQLLPNYE